MKELQHKNVFVVLGMARSGTSVISRGLKAIGVDLGNHFTPSEKCPWNPKGSWEDIEIVYKINEKVYKTLNYKWDTVQLIAVAPQTSENLSELKNTAKQLLQKRFAGTDYWGFKDPRTTKILSFWQSIFTAEAINDHYIIVLRNPLASAHSYQRLTGADIEHGLLLWLSQLFAAVSDTQGKQRVIVSYELMMQDPRKQLDRIKKHLQIPDLSDNKEIDAYINEFLDKNLLHYEKSSTDLRTHYAAAVTPLSIKMYDWLYKIAQDEINLDGPSFLSAWQEINQGFAEIAPIYNYIDSLLRRNNDQENYIRGLHKSRLWKIIYPLRKLDIALRNHRKAKRLRQNDK